MLKMFVDDKKKIVEFWLTIAEQNDPAFLKSLKPLYDTWQEKKYLPVVFRSGGRDLLELTEGLLLHNRTVAACRDIALEQRYL